MSHETQSGDEEAVGSGPVEYNDWREALESGTLLGVECGDCGHVSATPKRVCNECGSRDLIGVELPQSGEVHSETTIAVPPVGVEGPYCVGVVDLGPARLLARIDGEAEIGEEVTFTGTVEDEGAPGPVFEHDELTR